MIIKPKLIKNFLSPNILATFQAHAEVLKAHKTQFPNDGLFQRYGFHNDAKFAHFHHQVITPMAMKIFGMELKPTYNFLSSYFPGKGVCPVHVDRAQCLLTIDICLNQHRPWPIYINSTKNFERNGVDIFFQNDLEEKEKILQESDEYIMHPGDAVCYSGTQHPHWRKTLDADNFCDLVFFHFVRPDFEGDLG